jgi:hypothetical protein
VTAREAGSQSSANASPGLPAPAAGATLAREGLIAHFLVEEQETNKRRWERAGGGQEALKRKYRGKQPGGGSEPENFHGKEPEKSYGRETGEISGEGTKMCRRTSIDVSESESRKWTPHGSFKCSKLRSKDLPIAKEGFGEGTSVNGENCWKQSWRTLKSQKGTPQQVQRQSRGERPRREEKTGQWTSMTERAKQERTNKQGSSL